MNKSDVAVNTATLSLTIDYCSDKLKCWSNLNPGQMPTWTNISPKSDALVNWPHGQKPPS